MYICIHYKAILCVDICIYTYMYAYMYIHYMFDALVELREGCGGCWGATQRGCWSTREREVAVRDANDLTVEEDSMPA